jgi:hypothetical protein
MASKPKLDKIKTKPREITEQDVKIVLDKIAEGSPYHIACYASNFSYRHFKYLVAQGKLDIDNWKESFHSSMVVKLKNIEHNKIVGCLQHINEGSKSSIGSQWFLERKYWKDFSSKAETLQMAEELEEIKEMLKEQSREKENG